jgi:NAD(P)-dependent dehydrogenase (short-subunit alcohol dehydrogenase family)
MSVLEGRIALVTGASRGIGRAVAEVFARVGATVIICGRKIEVLENVMEESVYLPGRMVPVQCHVGRLAEMEAMVTKVLAEFGRIDILVNNAAVNTYRGPCLDFGETEFDRIVDVNVKSVYRLTRLVAPGMADRGSGSIINIAALAGIRPEPDNLLYNMTKAAVISMTKSYALELSPKGVRVNAIAPGVVDTEMTAHIWQDEERLRAHLARQPVQHLGQPEEIAEVALTLASERSSLVTGQVFVVDGGLLLT